MRTVIVEARPSDATGQPVDIRLAGGGCGHYLFNGQSDWRAGVISLPRLQSSLGFGKDGFTGGAVAQASAIGFSPAMASTRALVAGLIWNDAAITVSVADDEAADPSFKVRLAGTVAGYSVSAGRFVFTLSDMAGRLGEPLVKDTFAGTGGIEGDAAAKGRVKRRSWGRCWNVEGRVLLAAYNVYEFGDPTRQLGAFDAIKDKGRPVTIVTVAWAGSVTATLDALKAAQVPDGGCAAAPSIACVKFWTQPSTLTADLRGELGAGYVEHVPGIAAAISAAAEGPGLDGLAALAGLRPDPAGLHADDASETPAQMLDRLCLRASLSWGVTADRRLALRPIAFADPVETITFEDVERRAAYAPVASVKVGFQKNHRVHTDGEISAAILAGDVVFPDGQKVADLQPAQKGADVTGQNTAADTKAVAGRPAATVVAQLDRIEPIGRDTAELKEAQKDLDDAVDRLRQSDDAAVVALAQLRGVVLDGAATQRQLQRAEGKLAAATLQLLMMSDAADTRMRDAGFITDPATGKVYAYALDRLGDRQTKVEATLDAQAGQIALRATSTEVDEKILKAVLNPEQVAQLEPLLARIAAVEVVYDALKAEVRTKAELVELTKAVARITNAEQRISAAEGLIASKVEQTSFDQALTRIGSAEQLLQSYGEVSRYSVELRQSRAARSQSDQALLASILGDHQADELRLAAQALLRQELYAKIVDGDALEARARTEIGLRLRDLDARSVQDRFLSIDRDAVLAQDIDALGVQNSQQSAEIASLKKTSLAAGVGIAGIEQTIRQQARGQSQADAALLSGILGSDQAESRFITSLAEIHSQLTTTLVAGFQAEAVARQGLRARIDSADARFDQEARSTADRIRAVTQLITSLGARFDDQATGLAATQSDLSRLERVTAEAAQANVDAITQLRAIVTDPKTGLEKTRTALTSLSELVATQNTAAIRRLDLLEGQVNDPATGLAWARGAIADLARVTTSRDDAAAESIRQVRAEVDGVGGVGLEQAMKAVVDRLGKIEGTITFKIDVDGNITGLQLVGGAKGPGSLNLINTDLRLGTGLLIKNTGAFMSVEGVGFGVAKDLVEWFGPTMAVDKCSRANAITYKTINGEVYTGGSFSAGTLRNGSASSSLAADAVAEVPAFGSNGKPVRYVASWSYYSEYTRTFAADNDGLDQFNRTVASFNATSDDGGAIYFGSKNDQRDSSTITLSRAFAGASYAQLDQRSWTTEQVTFRGLKPSPGDAPGRATFTASIGGGFTVLDPVQSTANRTLRLALSRGFTLSEGVIQRLTIVAIEE
ncbi:coiled-coil domain-containing protein [Sphingomonas sanguinis]|jgi:hypothetical protein|uniref:DUF1983 domain-containing protein n=1 Tax=Sphingomonas sanguinis TaxID=33051 RepID=A0A7Y7QXD1_9SPHN|nr:hypothetical protein [Sphingomonas sanguinis]MBZ6383143.1 hypothetical protein [Sphingomonas sanguinis]NNG50005.1 hypothetical protein [Sphingomonas sanguinis]NNG53659.1 hypothetical protein [Sphingomonas sanguinis]NVP32439.1 hypothetical protein [Sphingomonas sanguinis]